MPKGMAHQTLAGLLWTVLGTGARGLVQLLVLVMLARLLTVTDFGVVTVALAVIGFLVNLSRFAIGPPLVQLPHLELRHIRVAFTVSLLFSGALWILVRVSAPVLAVFFKLPALTPVLGAMAWLLPLQGLFTVAESLMQRRMRFRALAEIDAATYALGYGAVGIGLALLGFGVWSLVGASLAQGLLRTVLLLALQRHPMRPLAERGVLVELLRFGGGLVLAKIGNYVAVEGDNVVVGRWLGAEAVGVYGRAYQLMAMPAMFIGDVLDKVLFPGMARLQDQPGRLSLAYGRAVSLVALLVLPTSAGLVVLTPEIVNVLLGPKWTAVTVPFQIFAAGMLFRTSYKISDAAVRATGAVYRRALRQAFYAMLVLGGAWIGQRWGCGGGAVGVVGTIALNFVLMAQLSLAVTGMSWSRFWNAHVPGVTVALICGAVVGGVALVLRGEALPPIVVLGVSAVAMLSSLLVLVRYLPALCLGEDGRWMLQTLLPYMPTKWTTFDWVRRLLQEAA